MQNPVPIIVLAQLFGTSLWFSANAAGGDLMAAWGLQPADLGRLTNAVQLGFILGTLGFSLTGLADRFAASRIFAVCAVLGAAANAASKAFLPCACKSLANSTIKIAFFAAKPINVTKPIWK